MSSDTDELVAHLRAALDFKDALTGGTDGGEFRDAVAGKQWTELDQAFDRAAQRRAQLSDTLMVVLDREQEPRFDKISEVMTEQQRAAVAEALERFAASTTGRQASAARHAIHSWKR